MLKIEKIDFTRFYKCKNSQKECFILDSATGEGVITSTQTLKARYSKSLELSQKQKTWKKVCYA